MRFVLMFALWLPALHSFADAGFSIRREKKSCVIRVSGSEKLGTAKLVYMKGDTEKSGRKRYRDEYGIVDPGFETVLFNSGRGWHESDRNIKFVLVDTVSNIASDSLQFVDEDYDLHIIISGAKDGKLQYRVDSTKAIYKYALTGNESDVMDSSRNRLILIGCSVFGLLLLLLLFVLKKNKTVTEQI